MYISYDAFLPFQGQRLMKLCIKILRDCVLKWPWWLCFLLFCVFCAMCVVKFLEGIWNLRKTGKVLVVRVLHKGRLQINKLYLTVWYVTQYSMKWTGKKDVMIECQWQWQTIRIRILDRVIFVQRTSSCTFSSNNLPPNLAYATTTIKLIMIKSLQSHPKQD